MQSSPSDSEKKFVPCSVLTNPDRVQETTFQEHTLHMSERGSWMEPREKSSGLIPKQCSSQDARGASTSAPNTPLPAGISAEQALAADASPSGCAPQRLTLPTDSEARKGIPLFSGLRKYFPAALAGVAKHSKLGNDKHNPGEPMHHARGKSGDHADCIDRHLTDLADLQARYERTYAGSVLTRVVMRDSILAEANALCWRALALSQELHEQLQGAPLAPGAK